MSLIQEKAAQAIDILNEQETDLWLTFVRETSGVRDPALDLLVGSLDLTWQSALILTRRGEKIAIVGNLEAEAVRRLGVFDTILGYDTAFSPVLRETMARLDPAKIAVNTSRNNVHADGLTHAMYEMLLGYLADTPFAARLASAEPVINALRGRKTAEEQKRIARAVEIADEILHLAFEFIHPGVTEREIAGFVHTEVAARGLELAWPAEGCPAVNSGPDSPFGHSGPTEIRVAPGHIVHFDFGVKYEGFCSDIQRVCYVLRPGEQQAPPEVQSCYDALRRAIEAARAAMQPGVAGGAIDTIARDAVMQAGYPSYPHALGHQLGRVPHDGGALLGPLWEKYGDSPNQPLEAGQVFTIEPSAQVPGYGILGLEEDVVLTARGAKYLAPPQTDIALIKS